MAKAEAVPSRTRQLSPSAPMVLVGRPAGRGGRCQELNLKPGLFILVFILFLAKICWLKKDPESIFHRSFMFRVLVGNMITCMVSLDRWKNGPGFLFCDTVR